MSKKNKNNRLDDRNDSVLDKRNLKKSTRNNKAEKIGKKIKNPDMHEPIQYDDGLSVERHVGKQKRERNFDIKLPSFNYTKKMRNIGAKRGETVFFVSGKYGVRVLGALSKICAVKNVSILTDGVQFEVPSKHRGQIIAFLDNLCYDYKIIKVKGAFPLAMNAVSRVGFALGALLIVVAISVFSQFVTRVSVVAADGYIGAIDGALNARIDGILSEYGVSEGKWLPSVNLGDVEKSLLALDGVSYASVRRHGTHVEVEIKREQPPESFVEVSGSKVISQKLAVVTRVIVEGGTAVVDYGDVVKKGDTLIDGYVVFGEDKLEVEAKGIVYGKVFYKKQVFFADVETKREIGSTKRVTKLSMFGKVPKPPKSPFEKYELETTVSDLGFLLPFKIYTYEFREIVESEHQNDLTDEEMCDRVYSEIVAGFKEPSKVFEKYCDVSAGKGGKYVTVTVEAEERIA